MGEFSRGFGTSSMEGDRTELDLDVIGQTGLKRSGGYIFEEWHHRLRGTRAVRVYREMMDNEAVIGGFLYAMEALIRQADWTINPTGDTEGHKAAAEFVQSAIDDMDSTWPDFLSEVLTFLPFGWSYFELLFKRRLGDNVDPRKNSKHNDGKIGWRNIAIRGQESLMRWEIDNEGGILGMHQLAPPDYKPVFIPITKALLFRTKSNKNNPEGRSVLRNAFRSWYFLKRIQEHEAIGVSKNLSGMLKQEVPFRLMLRNASAEDKALRSDLEKIGQRAQRGEHEVLMVPSELDPEDGNPTGFKTTLLSASGRPIDTNAIITRYENRIAVSTMSEFLLIGTQNVGSFALASTKTALFSVALGSYMDMIAQTFTRFAIRDLCRLNTIPEEFWPELTHGDIEKPELEEIAQYVATLTTAGMNFTDSETEEQLRKYAGLPIPTDGVPAEVPDLDGSEEDEEDERQEDETLDEVA